MLPLIANNLLTGIHLLANGVRALSQQCVEGMEPNLARLNETLARNPISRHRAQPGDRVTNAPRRFAKRAYAEGRPVFDVSLEMSGLEEDELRRLLDPAALIHGGLHGGRGAAVLSDAPDDAGLRTRILQRFAGSQPQHDLADWRVLGVDAELSRKLARHLPQNPVARCRVCFHSSTGPRVSAFCSRSEPRTWRTTPPRSPFRAGGSSPMIRTSPVPPCAKRRRRSVSIRRACGSSAIYPITW